MIGMGVDGQMMDFTTSLRAVRSDWSGWSSAAQQGGRGGRGSSRGGGASQSFVRQGNNHTLRTTLADVPAAFTTAITDTGTGTARIDVEMQSSGDASLAGVYYCFDLSGAAICRGFGPIDRAGHGDAGRIARRLAP